jgi:3-dehydroquinate synthase
VRIPTTVLSQNDGGVGVKNGVNAFGIKNFLGAFAPPWAVVCDSRFLQTLPDRDRRAGMAEAVKVALVRDADFFEWLHAHRGELSDSEPAAMRWMIRRCAELHLEHIARSGDPFEQGSARPLDFGHWAAHKLEGMTAHALRHGEAVAIGIAIDSVYSSLAGLLAPAELEAILEVLRGVGLPLWHDALRWTRGDGRLQIHAGLDEFRQHLGGALTVTLLDGIGRGREVGVIDEALVEQAISALQARREAP